MLLTMGMYTAPVFGVACLLGVLAAVTNAGFVTFRVNGEVVSGHEFLARAGLAFSVLGVLALGIAYGVWQERSWTRWLILGFWAIIVALDIGLGWSSAGLGGAASGIAGIGVFVVVAGWYVLGKENVVEYYRALERTENARAGTVTKGGA
jgi:hypothetical protein